MNLRIHLDRDMNELRREILAVGALAEDATNKALRALIERRAELAQEVIEGDEEIDAKEVQVEEECLKILALHQPVAADLRSVIAIMKVNNDLERVGDLAGNLAARAKFLASQPPAALPPEIEEMGKRVRIMLRECLDAVVNADTVLAHKVLEDDEIVDSTHKSIYKVLETRMTAEPDEIERLMQFLSVSRYLERIADLATNIAEDVVFMVNGDVIRHQGG